MDYRRIQADARLGLGNCALPKKTVFLDPYIPGREPRGFAEQVAGSQPCDSEEKVLKSVDRSCSARVTADPGEVPGQNEDGRPRTADMGSGLGVPGSAIEQ